MPSALAYSNNDIGLVVWKYERKIEDCLGFAVSRIDLHSRIETDLPAWVGFKGQEKEQKRIRNTKEWPVQKFNWRDFTAKRGGFYRYKVRPMIGKKGELEEHPNKEFTFITNPVHIGPECGDISVYFNRGIIATQAVSRSLKKGKDNKPTYRELTDRLDQPGDPLRNRLAADMRVALFKLLERAKTEGGSCYCALYEFNDPELESILIGSPYAHIILSNTGPDDSINRPTRQALHESNTDTVDRMLGSHIGHNKFVVYVDSNDNPQAVLTGSTNWTASALCGQTNNAVVIESNKLATLYLDYWNLLKEDKDQSLAFREKNNVAHTVQVDNGNTDITLWFSPNTKLKNKPQKNPAIPSDMQEVFDRVQNAKQAILFLFFKPGKPNAIERAREAQKKNPELFVRGAVTDEKLISETGSDIVDLYHHSADKPDDTVIAPASIDDEFTFWQKELLKSSAGAHAIIHDKIIVIDPFLPDCTVITGSHNLGLAASYNNDENMLIIKNNYAVAEAYAVHIMDVYDHYRWRNHIKKYGTSAWNSLEETDKWQDKYFKPTSKDKNSVQFWLSGAGIKI
jgi:phosphatidylserine/phosphatidylglycerophosphate/cardiolipin synthase-like enzyme